jgi:non-canonical poly(A) RNA polymerase PAPD5/7
MSNIREFRGDSYQSGGGPSRGGGDSYRPGGDHRNRDSRRDDQFEFSFRAKDQINIPNNDSQRGSWYRPDYPQDNSQPLRPGGPNAPSGPRQNKNSGRHPWKKDGPVMQNDRAGQAGQNKFAPISAPTAPNGNSKNSAFQNGRNNGPDHHGIDRYQPNGRPRFGTDHPDHPDHMANRPKRLKSTQTPLATLVREKTPELFVTDQSKTGQNKFKNISPSSDHEGAEMDMETDTEKANPPPKKLPSEKDVAEAREITVAPKWSNPDVYTALTREQVMSQSSHKGMRIIDTIRKARNAPEQSKEANAVTDNDDFLSLDMESVDINPKGSNGSRVVVDLRVSTPTKPKGQSAQMQPTKAKNVLEVPEEVDSALGSRKRTHDDEIKTPPKKGRCGPKSHQMLSASIVPEWRPKNEKAAAPWFNPSQDTNTTALQLLTVEVLEFYNFVKPKDFEDAMRNDLISRTERSITNSILQSHGAVVRPFGSFAAGLYLPNGDMDLVLHGQQFQRTNRPEMCQRKNQLFQFYHALMRTNLCLRDSATLIANARVPIIKWIDDLTGLHVDLSFDNASGTNVVGMYHDWNQKYPTLPILASIIKQFLMMRSLNDVAIGGLGGYSVICLVVSFLQHTPPEKHHDYGELLLNFLDFYGNKFDISTYYISLDPPGYFPKVCLQLNAKKYY